jgi:hypothetical protein
MICQLVDLQGARLSTSTLPSPITATETVAVVEKHPGTPALVPIFSASLSHFSLSFFHFFYFFSFHFYQSQSSARVLRRLTLAVSPTT